MWANFIVAKNFPVQQCIVLADLAIDVCIDNVWKF